VTDSLLGLLKLCLLALLYLFFLRVLWAVWTEVRGPKMAKGPAPTSSATKGKAPKRRDVASRLTVTDPKPLRGAAFDLGAEVTVGRGGGCQIALPDDTYVSTLHARVFQRDGQAYVEDLGSTNGTYVNGGRVTSPVPLRRGDRLQVGSTVLEVG
jgi:pSer/pThr/pTyr-binding forkhead associated (FHA) protein